MGVTFEIDHIIPQSLGGATQSSNLCLTCPPCNRHKSNRITISETSLFHPTQNIWSEHFAWNDDRTILLALTSIGKVTIKALHINRPEIVQLRSYWVALALHPPKI
jgi:hypothetical protein